MSNVRFAIVVVFAAFVVVVGTERTAAFLLELRHTDQAQDARLDELQLELREMKAAPERKVDPLDADAIVAVPVGASPQAGPADALVTVVEFLDYQCPFCGRAQDTIAELRRANPDIRVVVKHNPLPFHKNAMQAAVAAECANEQGSFWPLHDALYANQRSLDVLLSDPTWSMYGLDAARMRACTDGAHAKSEVEEEAQAARSIGANGTPTFFINGRRLTGAQPLESFQKAVDRARSEAVASGIPASRYYVDGVLARATVR